jgi:hypothetical protein
MRKHIDKRHKPTLATLLKPYGNKWVALSPDEKRVLSSGDTIDEVEQDLDPHIVPTAIFFKVPPAGKLFVPHLP